MIRRGGKHRMSSMDTGFIRKVVGQGMQVVVKLEVCSGRVCGRRGRYDSVPLISR